MIRKCDRCNRRRECTPVPSVLGLRLGYTCGICQKSELQHAQKAIRALGKLDCEPTRVVRVFNAYYVRRFPVAHRIAAELVKDRALLALRTRRLADDVCSVFHVSQTTARLAVAMARRTA